MNSVILLIGLSAAFLMLVLLLWIILKLMQDRLAIQKSHQLMQEQQLRSQNETIKKHAELMDKAMGLLSSKDPMSFQAIQSMNFSQDLASTVSTDVSEAKEALDTIIKTKGGLTQDEADYFRLVEGIDVDDNYIKQ